MKKEKYKEQFISIYQFYPQRYLEKRFEKKPSKELISKDELPRFCNNKRYVYSECFLECDPSLAMSYLHLNMDPSKQQLDKLIFKSLANKKKEKTEWKEKLSKLSDGFELSFTIE